MRRGTCTQLLRILKQHSSSSKPLNTHDLIDLLYEGDAPFEAECYVRRKLHKIRVRLAPFNVEVLNIFKRGYYLNRYDFDTEQACLVLRNKADELV